MSDPIPLGAAPVAPPPVPRPKFALWIWERRLELKPVAQAIGCSYEQVRLITLPFGDPARRVPAEDLLERIVAYTRGDIVAADFYPEHLQRPQAVPAAQE